MDLSHQRAGCIQNLELTLGGNLSDFGRYTVSAEYYPASGGNVVQLLHKDHALGLELVNHILVVDYFTSYIERRAIDFERQIDDIDGTDDAGAEAPR